MRRLGAIFLILLFAGVPVFSALATKAASLDLPACCKKNGAHMCSMRRGQARQQEDGKAGLRAVCPFAGKTTLAVAGQRMGSAVGTSYTSTPVPASRINARPEVLVLASTGYLENSKRGPPSVFFQS